MSEQHTNDSEWLPCPPGEFGRCNERVRANERRQAARPLLATTLTVLLVAAVFYGLAGVVGTSPDYGGITCANVQRNAAAFIAGTLPEATHQKIERHLKSCSRCAEMIRRERESQADDGPLPVDSVVLLPANPVGGFEQRDDGRDLPDESPATLALASALPR